MNKRNNKKTVKALKCPKCNSFLSYDLFEPTCIMCGLVDYSEQKKDKIYIFQTQSVTKLYWRDNWNCFQHYNSIRSTKNIFL